MLTDGRTDGRTTDGRTTDGRTTDDGVTGILIALLGAFGSGELKRPKNGFQDRLLLNAGQKYCRILQWEHFAKLSTFIKLPVVIKIFVLSVFEWPFYTGFTVQCTCCASHWWNREGMP